MEGSLGTVRLETAKMKKSVWIRNELKQIRYSGIPYFLE